jgi:hypothetical protein
MRYPTIGLLTLVAITYSIISTPSYAYGLLLLKIIAIVIVASLLSFLFFAADFKKPE